MTGNSCGYCGPGLGADERIREKRRFRAAIGKAIRRVAGFKRQCLPFDGGEEPSVAGANTGITRPASQHLQKSIFPGRRIRKTETR